MLIVHQPHIARPHPAHFKPLHPCLSRPLTPVASGGMSEGALSEMRSRLIAGLKRYFHGKRMEGLLSVQVRQ